MYDSNIIYSFQRSLVSEAATVFSSTPDVQRNQNGRNLEGLFSISLVLTETCKRKAIWRLEFGLTR